MGIADFKIDIGTLFSGIGSLAKDIRTAFTGKEPIDATKAAELALKVQELEFSVTQAQMSVVLAESQSQDKWTSRGRPMFLYVIYIMLLASIPMGVVYALSPETSQQVTLGFKAWLDAIPGELYAVFATGYLGYGAFRSYDKGKGTTK